MGLPWGKSLDDAHAHDLFAEMSQRFCFGFPIHVLFKRALKIYSIGMTSFFGKAKVLLRGFFVVELLLRRLFLVLFTTILFDPSYTLDRPMKVATCSSFS
jgi:hypothetical protein